MRDVIFAGCDTRGKSKFAEVSLEFDNSKGFIKNYPDTYLKVSRRADIDGKSAYYINDELARLKDVQDLFLDTGIGNDSYSMIGQEQTKKLLSSKIEDRRAIFEEASGIVRLKNQKEATEKSLAEVEQNFLRLNDILKELDKQLKPLKKQKEKADHFLDLTFKLESIEIDFISKKVQLLTDKFIILSQENNELIERLSQDNERLTFLEENTLSLKNSTKTKNDSIHKLQSAFSKVEQELLIFNKQLENFEERNRDFSKQMQVIDEDIDEIQQKYNVSFSEIERKNQRLAYLKDSISSKGELKNEFEKSLFLKEEDVISLKSKVEHLRKDVTNLYNTFNEAKINFDQFQLSEQKILRDINDIQNDSMISLNERFLNDIKEQTVELDRISLELFKLNDDLSSSNMKEEQLNKSIVELDKLTYQLKTDLASKSESLHSLEQSNEKKDYLPFSVRKIIENKDKFSGFVNVISSLAQPKKGFEIAIDSLLGNTAQFILLEDFSFSKPIIQFLKEHNYGYSSFLSIKDSKPRRFSQNELSSIASFEGASFALDFLDYDETYESIFSQLLGRTIVFETLDQAISFSKTNNFSFKGSTLEGEIIQPGVVSGGSKTKKGVFSAQKELFSLTEEVTSIEKRLIETEKFSIVQKQELFELVASIKTITDSISTFENEEKAKTLAIEKMKLEQQNLLENTKEKQLRLSALQNELNQIKNASSAQYDQYKHKKNEYENSEKKLDELINLYDESVLTVSNMKEESHQIIMTISTQQEELKNLELFLDEYRNGSNDFEKKIVSLQERKKIIDSEFSLNEIEVDRILEERVTKTEQIDILERELLNAKNSYSDEHSELEKFENEQRQLIKERESFTSRNNELNLSINDLSNQIQVFVKRAQDAYQIEREDLLKRPVEDIDLNKVEKNIDYLKNEIKKIGNVNIESIQDFINLDERYQKEHTQYLDIKNAKEDLDALLKNVRDEMKERFLVTFKQIAIYFETAFTDLFGGGRAKLSLEDPRNPLSSNIKIMAQPPGKKPNSIESLSGGEKALTVSALIFAIIKTKPSPFVYLDEIDAPLDDANVSRFAYYLKKNSDNSQFIVVTHRKGTMMAADTLFGVTQEEPGITIVFPHKLETALKEA
jgi:chromosome segregation protein